MVGYQTSLDRNDSTVGASRRMNEPPAFLIDLHAYLSDYEVPSNGLLSNTSASQCHLLTLS